MTQSDREIIACVSLQRLAEGLCHFRDCVRGIPWPRFAETGNTGGGAPRHSCARSDQTVRLETKEETQGIAFYLGQFQLFPRPLKDWDIPSAYPRSAVFAGRRAIEAEAVAARAADIASLC